LRRRQRTAGSVTRAAKIIDDDLRATACEPKCVGTAKTVTRAGDDRHASIKPDCHDFESLWFFFLSCPDLIGLDPGIHQNEHIFLISDELPGQARQ
jgi:hypothetical protein